jgi:hypothetical protein
MAMIETISAPSAIASETTAVAIANWSRRRRCHRLANTASRSGKLMQF